MPNRLTLFRVLLAPVFMVCFVLMRPWSLCVALAVAILIEVTDLLDGHLARSRNQVSEVGKFFDPFADSVSRFSEFLAIFYVSTQRTIEGSLFDGANPLQGMMALWMIACIFYRDVLVAYLRIAAANRHYIISARTSGKIKAVFQGIAVISITVLVTFNALTSLIPWPVLNQIGYYLLALITVVTVLSGIDYVWGNRQLLREPEKTA